MTDNKISSLREIKALKDNCVLCGGDTVLVNIGEFKEQVSGKMEQISDKLTSECLDCGDTNTNRSYVLGGEFK